MVNSKVYPGLERKSGGPDNWVEATGGLPSYIERIAKHLHYEQHMTISHAIATAVNTVKRWAHQGKVVKWRDPNNKHVTTITAAQAAAAVAQWEAMKARARTGAATPRHARISLSSGQPGRQMDLAVLAERANRIEDPVMRGKARQAVIDLALTKDGRKSFKNTGGKFKHGFIPIDTKAKVAKAKGSPIAMKRINRLFGGGSKEPKAPKPGIKVGIKARKGTGTERVQTVAQAQRLEVRDAKPNQKVVPPKLEVSRGRRPTKRSNQAWEKINDADKVVRNGKRYVLTSFGGRQSLTEWVGPGQEDVAAPDSRDKVMTDITSADLAKLTTAALRRMLEMPTLSDSMRKILNKELARKERLGLVGGKLR